MLAVAGPSKRFCHHCCRASWQCDTARKALRTLAVLPSQASTSKSTLAGFRKSSHNAFQRSFSSTPVRIAAKKARTSPKDVDMNQFPPERIRNLSIIAHIDHGKSTLADRLLQMTNTVPADSSPQFLDKLKVERERGITVKAQTVSIVHTHTDGKQYLINLIDTPGHVDFSYEVSRSLGACEGGLLLVDSSQGIQAQTLSVFYVALEADLTVLGVLNKIDLPHAEPDQVSETIESSLGIEKAGHIRISAKSGIGVDEVLRQIIECLPSPRKPEQDDGKLRALVFDTYYDHFRGVVALIRIFSGSVKIGDKIRFLQADRKYEVTDIGINNPEEVPTEVLKEGQVGYLICNMKNSEEAHIGDTVCLDSAPVEPLPGFKPMKSMVFAGVFPTDSADFDKLSEAIERLTLNDRSVTVQRESSAALLQGFRLGFLGTLHMDVFKQRLEDEYSSEVIVTSPTVPYRVKTRGVEKIISNPIEFPDETKWHHIEEPMIHATIIVPTEYIGPMMDLCSKYRSRQLEYKVLESGRAILRYAFPLAEIVTDFFSALKSVSSGFASFDYEDAGYEQSDLIKLNILLNGNPVDALSMIVHRSAAHPVGKDWCKRLKEVVPRQQFELAIQAAVGNKVVARETLPAMRKDVTAGLYGGHFERKKKHLEKQKAGKKRLKRLAGNIDVPQSAFFTVLSRSYSTHTSPVRPSWFTSRPLSTERATAPHESPALDLPFPSDLPDLEPTPVYIKQLEPPVISPESRSSKLSQLYANSDVRSHATSEEIYKTFESLYSFSRSHILTSGEVAAVINAMRTASRRFGGDVIANRVQMQRALNALRLLQGDTPFQQLQAMLNTVSHWHHPTEWEIKISEIYLNQLALKDNSSQEYKKGVYALLHLTSLVGDQERFENWWPDADRLGLDAYAFSAKLTLLDTTQQVQEISSQLQHAINSIKDSEPERLTGLVNLAVGIFARNGHWYQASQLYLALTGSSLFEDVRLEEGIKDLEGIPADRLTFSTILGPLAQAGFLNPSIQVISDMNAAGSTPFVPEYSAIFRGFARHSGIVPRNGTASTLFPPWKTYAMGQITEEADGQLLQGEGYESDWSRAILENTFEALMSLSPDMRGVSSPSHRVDARRAPAPEVAFDIMMSFARLTGCDEEVLKDVWKRMDDKFSGQGWTRWQTRPKIGKRITAESSEVETRGRLKALHDLDALVEGLNEL